MNPHDERWMVTRNFSIPSLLSAADASVIEQRLATHAGVVNVSASPRRHRLRVRYLATLTDYRSLCHALADAGYRIGNGFWARIAADWNQEKDHNRRVTAGLPPAACCNHAPVKPK